MQFCEVCDNMLYQQDGASLFCRVCHEVVETKKNTYISRREISGNSSVKAQIRKQIVSPYTKFDPTLPRTRMPCVNGKNTAMLCENTDIIAIRYDNDALKYMYLCPVCDAVWDQAQKE
jgi:DNA-directed RNA polymerase subunit M/transcription elongation factor TFIIS